MFDYYLGLDLGQSNDPTALSIIEEAIWVPAEYQLVWNAKEAGWVSPAMLGPFGREQARQGKRVGRPDRPALRVRHLDRYPLGTSYPDVVRLVKEEMGGLSQYRVALVVDATGVGAPVVDLLAEAGLKPVAVTITGGDTVTFDPPDYRGVTRLRVPKRDLASSLQVVMYKKRLLVAGSLPHAQTLTKELLAFKVKITTKGHDTYGNDWRENPHDDLVLAVALPVWYREWFNTFMDQAAEERPPVQLTQYDYRR